jgi:hypothetical protein
MPLDSVTSSPAFEAISQITDTVSEFLLASGDVLVKKGSFKELGDYLQRIAPILKQLRKEKVSDSETFNNAIEILNREIKDAKKLVQECSKKSKVYLLVNCRTVANRLKHNTSEISRAGIWSSSFGYIRPFCRNG